MDVEHSLKRVDLDERGSSLSVDAECPAHVKHEVESEEQLGCLDLRSEKSTWQNSSLGRQPDKLKGTHRSLSAPSNVKPLQRLRLPSFKTLGIVPYTGALLTPPDEASLIHGTHPSSGMPDPPTSQPAQELIGIVFGAKLPEAPVFSGSISEEQSNAPTSTSAVPTIAVPTDDNGGGGSPSSGDEAPTTPSWIESGTKAIGTLGLHGQPQNASLTQTVSSIISSRGTSNVLNVLCHTQPCPLSKDVTNVPTAFAPIITALQSNPESNNGRYIEVTHAVPRRFDMARLPTSPVGTPSQPDAGDYFSMMVYSKAVIAVDHHSASNNPYPSSPHPVVAPSSVGVSILERFIPPTTTAEYIDLFSTDGPSVLVDRLVELSPDGGNLIFVYPTANGASNFTSKYLGPLLDPLLRTMVGVHGLSADLGADVGKMTAVDHMSSFENMTKKIAVLLRKLNRGSSLGRSNPKYTLVQSRRENVPVERDVWKNWWVTQEAPRIREVMNRYFQRAVRLPQRDMTAGTLVREILDGVESRSYAEYDPEREGIEVGVFILKRTA